MLLAEMLARARHAAGIISMARPGRQRHRHRHRHYIIELQWLSSDDDDAAAAAAVCGGDGVAWRHTLAHTHFWRKWGE